MNSGQIGVADVNWLIRLCGMNELFPVYEMRECSSSFFVVLIQRLLHYRLSGLELEPDTNEKKLKNMRRVLEELESITQLDLSVISPAEIVNGNESHIAMLVHVFLELAKYVPRREDDEEEDDEEAAEDSAAANASSGGVGGAGAAHQSSGEYVMHDERNVLHDGPEDIVDHVLHHLHHPDPHQVYHHHPHQQHYHHSQSPGDASSSRVYSVPPPAPAMRHASAAEGGQAASTPQAGAPGATTGGGGGAAAETASSVSNADSANFTNQLVHDWKVEVVKAAPRPFGAGIDPLTLVNVRQRLDSLDKAVSSRQTDRRNRPTAHDSRARVVDSFVERYQSARGGGGDVASGRVTAVIARAQREERTAAIRAVKTHRQLQDNVRRELVRARSLLEQRVVEELKESLKIQRRDYVEAKRRVREESDVLMKTMSDKVSSIASHRKLQCGTAVTLPDQSLLSTNTKHMVREHAGAVREAKRTAKQWRKAAREQLDADLRQYTRLHGAVFALHPEEIV